MFDPTPLLKRDETSKSRCSACKIEFLVLRLRKTISEQELYVYFSGIVPNWKSSMCPGICRLCGCGFFSSSIKYFYHMQQDLHQYSQCCARILHESIKTPPRNCTLLCIFLETPPTGTITIANIKASEACPGRNIEGMHCLRKGSKTEANQVGWFIALFTVSYLS